MLPLLVSEHTVVFLSYMNRKVLCHVQHLVPLVAQHAVISQHVVLGITASLLALVVPNAKPNPY